MQGNQDRRLFDTVDAYGRGQGGGAPQKSGLSHESVIQQVGTSNLGVIIENKASDLDVQLCTFSVDANVISDPKRSVSALCQLDWGVGGTAHTALINVKRGTIFTVGCSYYRLTAMVEGATADDLGTQIVFRASAAYGAHPGAKAPTRDFALELGRDATSNDIEIPPYARLASVLLSNPTGAPAASVEALFFGDIADTVGQITYSIRDTDYPLRDMTFGFDHTTMRLTKSAGAGPQNVLVSFELAF